MRLSEAILLGDSLKRCSPWEYDCELGGSGCAIAGARLAAGMIGDGELPWASPLFKQAWPWVTFQHINDISNMYFSLADGNCTIEEIADYVRSVEPEEAPEQAEVFAENRTDQKIAAGDTRRQG
jgi:hypothetical protein